MPCKKPVRTLRNRFRLYRRCTASFQLSNPPKSIRAGSAYVLRVFSVNKSATTASYFDFSKTRSFVAMFGLPGCQVPRCVPFTAKMPSARISYISGDDRSVSRMARLPMFALRALRPRRRPSSGFLQTNLVSDTPGTAAHTDPFLINPWGIAFEPGQSFFIADNNGGSAKVFDPSGNPDIPVGVDVPGPSGSASASTPTGIVFNPIAQDLLVRGTPAQFLFATEDGTISTWATINGNFPANALLAVDDSASGAIYKGLAILTPQCCREYLALANFHAGFIATYDVTFNLLGTLGSFKDSNLPTGYAPFNIQQIGTQVFVTYAVQDAAGLNPVPGSGNGIVNVFDQEGNFIRRFASNGSLNAPWGIVQASANFAGFSNDILIGNFGDGTVDAFDLATGNFLGQLKDASGKVISNPGLWSLVCRSDGVGSPDTLYFTAGSSGEDHGLFGAISPQN
ncbi:MAG: TIGR03118 family protein [Acidobacteria bacterium]|nr:MAG: TIGR03118 family protein [Acidobacteriota bacterium]